MRPMFRDLDDRLRQVKDLSLVMPGHLLSVQCAPAARATRWKMLNHFVRGGHLPQRRALVSALATGLSSRSLALIADAGRLLQAIARGRLSAIRTIQAQSSLQFFDTLQQRHNYRIFLVAA
jgi:hypothetical protein